MDENLHLPPAPGDTPLSDVVETVDHALGEPEHRRGQFAARGGADITCLTCRNHFPAAGVAAHESTRLEGASDPGDMSMVVPVECPVCGASGSLVLRYGPEASADEAAVLVALPHAPSPGHG